MSNAENFLATLEKMKVDPKFAEKVIGSLAAGTVALDKDQLAQVFVVMSLHEKQGSSQKQ
jgi:hypothetical protein